MAAEGVRVGVKGLDKYEIRAWRRKSRREEKKQFYYDLHIDDWNPEPEFWHLDGILRGKLIPEDRRERYEALGWIRERETPPYYELTCRGEEAYAEGGEFVWEDEGDWYDDDHDDD